MQADPVLRVLEALEREGVRYAVFGAVAVNIHGLPRFTEDLDIFVAPERENVEALKRALRSVFDDPSIDEISADDLLGDYPAIQYVPPEGAFYIDIVTKIGEAFRYEDLETQRMPFGGQVVTVVTPRTLYRMNEGHGPPEGPHGCRGAAAEVRVGERLMGVRKFRSVEEMDGYRWYAPGDPVLYRAIRRVWELGYHTIQPHFPAGVHKHRTLESMNALQESWAEANFTAYQERVKRQMAGIEGKG